MTDKKTSNTFSSNLFQSKQKLVVLKYVFVVILNQFLFIFCFQNLDLIWCNIYLCTDCSIYIV